MSPVPPLMLNPAGNEPAETDQTKRAVPPDCTTLEEYAVPVDPSGNVGVVIVNAGATTIERPLVVEAAAAWMTRPVKFAVPEAVGVPVMVPALELMLNPAGKAPA